MVNYFDYNFSNSKGTVKAGDTFNSSLNLGKAQPYYTSDLVKDHPITITADAGGDSFVAVLDWAPVKVDTFMVYDKTTGKKGMCMPNSFGNITGDITGTVTPAGTLEIKGVAETDEITVTYRFENNVVKANGYDEAGFTNVPAAELQIKSVPVNAKTRTMRAYNTQCAA